MKPTLLIATLSMALAAPSAFAKSELETLRSLCQEQKRQINELEAANERLRAGSHETHSPSPAKSEAAGSATAQPAAAPNPAGTSTYTVKAGDNFDKIARKVGTKATLLAKSNGLKTSSIIHPGQKLKVPGTSASPVAAASKPATAAAGIPSASKSAGKTHKVQAGETLSSISKKHGISTQTIVAANPEVKGSTLRPGQVVNLGNSASPTTMISAPARTAAKPAVESTPHPAPAASAKSPQPRASSPVSSATSASAATAETKSAPAPAQPPVADKDSLAPNNPEKKIRPITIDGEMTYGEFATKHGTDAERLNALNGLDLTTATVLAKGSELYVPARP